MIAPKQAKPTLPLIDEYCENYKSLFSDVRTYEAFKNIHVGILSEIKRKTCAGNRESFGTRKRPGVTPFSDSLSLGHSPAQKFENPAHFKSFKRSQNSGDY